MIISKEILDRYYNETFNIERFKQVDPCGVVYQLIDHTDNQLDIELGALFVAMITWGNRKVIYPTALNMLGKEMAWQPAKFIRMACYENSYPNAKNECVYRTLNVPTFKTVCRNVHKAIEGHDTLEEIFAGKTTKEVIEIMCSWLAPAKVGTMDKSACKRICMYIRWMTRKTSPDLGIWKSRSQDDLYAVMDTHVMQLTKDILKNKQPSWKACEELTSIFKSWNPIDPLKYDIALMTLADTL